MRAPHDDRGLFSRLPDDPTYWDRLTAKIVDDAIPTLGSYREERTQWWSALAQYSKVLAVGASVAVVAAALLLPAGHASEAPAPSTDTYGIAPNDPLATPLISANTPPPMETLMMQQATERDE